MVCSNPILKRAIISILSKTSPKYTFKSSERPLSKLSENHKINVNGPTELKLWPFKDAFIIIFIMYGIYYRQCTNLRAKRYSDAEFLVLDSLISLLSAPSHWRTCVGVWG